MVQYLKTIQYITTFGIQCGEILKFSYQYFIIPIHVHIMFRCYLGEIANLSVTFEKNYKKEVHKMCLNTLNLFVLRNLIFH